MREKRLQTRNTIPGKETEVLNISKTKRKQKIIFILRRLKIFFSFLDKEIYS